MTARLVGEGLTALAGVTVRPGGRLQSFTWQLERFQAGDSPLTGGDRTAAVEEQAKLEEMEGGVARESLLHRAYSTAEEGQETGGKAGMEETGEPAAWVDAAVMGDWSCSLRCPKISVRWQSAFSLMFCRVQEVLLVLAERSAWVEREVSEVALPRHSVEMMPAQEIQGTQAASAPQSNNAVRRASRARWPSVS